MKNTIGKINIATGLFVMAGFMFYGFLLIYMRDFDSNKEAWVAASHIGSHFEARLAHVHGNLFSILNIIFGFLLMTLPVAENYAKWISRLALAGLLMPLGIFAELYLGLPYYLVLVGAVSIVSATILLGLAIIKIN